MSKIYGNATGGFGMPKTFVLTDKNGNEFTGVVVGERAVFTANAAQDIRQGKVAATDAGVVTGSAIIPNYETYAGQKVVKSGCSYKLDLSDNAIYDYTELQCIICPFDSSMDESVSAERVVIGDNVYGVNSTAVITTITKNKTEKTIDFDLTNTTDIPYIIRFFTYKELYT